MTGSDTSSNALFCKLQRVSAENIGIDPIITVSANASGGVVGKMISPQSIAVGAAAIGLVGKESDLFRFTVKHSFIMLFIMCIITILQAYVMTWMVPKYKMMEEAVVSQTTGGLSTIGYFFILFAALAIIIFTVLIMNRKKEVKTA